ncbi:carbohydrate-binding protein [Ruminococcus flavefaciens]|uniref:Probable pectate lyase C n=1 Tax=Ruminococcus flavefaciens TaxID=1265 RepID=A0A1M7K218_RUMFL|nr:carbohydrate-binding protein [Ruminococcus flavefaciens]SHM59221.1 Carbohydrate binding module (family 6) [Ruminococcus flavefaciens]
MILKRMSAIAVSLAAVMSAVDTGNIAVNSTAAGTQAVFFVAPDGSDSGDGSVEAPFATLEKARDEVRKINGSMTGDIVVYLRGGDYRVTKPVEFDTRDSGTGGFTIRYEAYGDEEPVINGAQKVTGWTKFNDKLWSAPLDRDIKLRNLYVNDRRANMGSVQVQAKGGYGDYNITAGQADWAWDSGKKSDGIVYDAGSMPRVTSNFDDLEVVNGTTWNENIVCSRDIKYDGSRMILLMQQPYGAIAQTPGWGAGFSTGGTHTIYNAFSFVDSEGEFFFDKTQKVLYYYPRSGEDMTTADVEAPVADGLIKIAGNSLTERVQNISFSGITFANTDYQLTEVAGSHGKTTCQAAQSYTAFADSNWHSKKYEMVDTLPAAIHITSSDNIKLTGNVVKHTGADGISMTNDVINSEVRGNFVTDITSSGITVGHPQHIYIGDAAWNNHEKFPKEVEGLCKNDLITENLLYDISVVHGFGGCAAITAYFVDSVKILNNTIEKTAYNGIHLGWGWCNFKDSTTCRDNMICYNRVINSLNRLHDSGGIYTIGQMPGTIINENYVQGIPAGGPGAPTYGLHNDEGTTYIEENDNVLEISPNVTYTINCEEYGDKHHLTIKRTYATVNKMGKNPPYSDIDTPIVVSDNVWPFAQYKVCLNSGITDEYRSLMPSWLKSAADYAFPASCATTGGSKLPVRKVDGNVWIAPDGTTSFKAGADMTRAGGSTGSIRTPATEGEYRIYVLDREGKILSKSSHILRIKGVGGNDSNVIEAENYDYKSGIDVENCSEGGSDVGYIEDGDYIGFKDIDLTGADKIDLRVASNGSGGNIEVRLDSADGKLIGKAEVSSTGGWQDWTTTTCNIEAVSGKHDVYLVFTGGESYLFNLNWWKPNTPAGEYILGDLNVDGEVDVFDLCSMRNAAVDGDAERFEAADINGDGAITEDDLVLLKKFLSGEIKAFV